MTSKQDTSESCARCDMIEDLRKAIHAPQDYDQAANICGALMGACMSSSPDQERFLTIFETSLKTTLDLIHDEAKTGPRQTVAGTGSVN